MWPLFRHAAEYHLHVAFQVGQQDSQQTVFIHLFINPSSFCQSPRTLGVEKYSTALEPTLQQLQWRTLRLIRLILLFVNKAPGMPSNGTRTITDEQCGMKAFLLTFAVKAVNNDFHYNFSPPPSPKVFKAFSLSIHSASSTPHGNTPEGYGC